MNKEEYFSKVIEAFKNMEFDVQNLTPETKFCDIPYLDSMSIVDFQINLKKLIGSKADEVAPIMEMSLGDFIDLLNS